MPAADSLRYRLRRGEHALVRSCNILVWLDGLNADDEKVEDHRDFGDRGHRCADDCVDRCGEVGGQERRKRFCDIVVG